MAIINAPQEQVRYDVGSPVPIGASEQARVMGDASARLGNAVFDLGEVLSRTGKEKDDQNARFEAKVLANELEIARQKQMVIQGQMKTINKPLDLTNSIDEAMAPLEEDLSSRASTDAARAYFKVFASDMKANMVPKELAEGTNLSNKRTEELFTKNMAQYSELMADAFSNPNTSARSKFQSLAVQMVQVEADVEASDLIRASEKQAKIREYQGNMVSGVVNRLKQDGNYNAAASVLNFYSNKGLFEQTHIDKTYNEIHKEEHYSLEKTLSQAKATAYFAEQDVKIRQDNQYRMLQEMMTLAKTPSERQYVLDLSNKSDINDSQRAHILSTDKEATRRQDDPTISRFKRRIITEGSSKKVLKDLDTIKGMSKSPLSEPGYQEILGFYRQMQGEDFRNKRMVLSQKIQIIEAYKKNTITALDDENVRREHEIRVEQVESALLDSFVKNPSGDINQMFTDVAVKALPSLGRAYNPSLSTGENLVMQGDPEIQAALRKVRDARKSGNTKAQEEANKNLEAVQRSKGLFK